MLHRNPNSKLTDKEPWRLEALFDLMWQSTKDKLQVEQDKKYVDEMIAKNISFSKGVMDNPRLLKYFR